VILRSAIACLLLLSTAFNQRPGQALSPPLRVAVVGFGSGSPPEIATVLASAFEESGRVLVVEPSQILPALKALSYEGSLNMSTEEARRLGSAIGCDFFVIGKVEVLTRSERAKESHQEALLAVMIIDGRSGMLAVFDLLTEQSGSSEKAIAALAKHLSSRSSGYVDQMTKFRAFRESMTPLPAKQPSEIERIEDIPLEGSPQAAGFKPPEFLSRVKPEYTADAERADINATVEVMVVLHSSGQIGETEITRWAGFGLEDSALRAIRQLKFNPATRNGQPISVRAMIRYNFRRIGQ
jgi:TonB family protein